MNDIFLLGEVEIWASLNVVLSTHMIPNLECTVACICVFRGMQSGTKHPNDKYLVPVDN